MVLTVWVLISRLVNTVSVMCCCRQQARLTIHYSDVLMSAMASQITSISSVYSAVCSGAYQINHQSSELLVFVSGIRRSPSQKTSKVEMFPFDDVIMHISAVGVRAWGGGGTTKTLFINFSIIVTCLLWLKYQLELSNLIQISHVYRSKAVVTCVKYEHQNWQIMSWKV